MAVRAGRSGLTLLTRMLRRSAVEAERRLPHRVKPQLLVLPSLELLVKSLLCGHALLLREIHHQSDLPRRDLRRSVLQRPELENYSSVPLQPLPHSLLGPLLRPTVVDQLTLDDVAVGTVNELGDRDVERVELESIFDEFVDLLRWKSFIDLENRSTFVAHYGESPRDGWDLGFDGFSEDEVRGAIWDVEEETVWAIDRE